MIIKVVFDDSSFLVGNRTLGHQFNESPSTRRFKVLSASKDLSEFEGLEVGVSVQKLKYWVIVK